MKNVIKYLKSKEWSLGNGQCPECYGHKPRNKWWTTYVGHENKCILAKSLVELGVSVVWKRINHSKHVRTFNNFRKQMIEKIKEYDNENK